MTVLPFAQAPAFELSPASPARVVGLSPTRSGYHRCRNCHRTAWSGERAVQVEAHDPTSHVWSTRFVYCDRHLPQALKAAARLARGSEFASAPATVYNDTMTQAPTTKPAPAGWTFPVDVRYTANGRTVTVSITVPLKDRAAARRLAVRLLADNVKVTA